MNIDITSAVAKLVKMSEQSRDAADALRFSQAVLNLAHAKATAAAILKSDPPAK